MIIKKLRATCGIRKRGHTNIDDKVIKHLAVVSIFIDFYKEGYLTDDEYKTVEDKIVKKNGIHPQSIYRLKLNDAKEKLLRK